MARVSLIHDDYGEIIMQYIPRSIRYEAQSGYQSSPLPGSDDPLLTWAGGSGLSVSYSAEFTGKNGLREARQLQSAARANPWKGASAPPAWNLVVGKRVIPVIVESVSLEESDFTWSAELEPAYVRAEVTLRKYRQVKISVRGA